MLNNLQLQSAAFCVLYAAASLGFDPVMINAACGLLYGLLACSSQE